MKNKYFKFYVVSLFSVIVFVSFIFYTDNDRIKRQQEFNDHYGAYAIDLPENVTFAGESVPIKIDDVRERFDRELLINTYWQSQTILFLKRKSRWFAVVEPILKRNNIPDDFKYLMLAESGLTNVSSPSGAVGFWQFLESTGKQYGLEISSEIDERYHVEKSTQAACDYLNKSFKSFANWTVVAASYNMGMDGIQREMDKQGQIDYYQLLLSEETSRYLFRIVALKTICNDPIKYGFHLRKRDFYEPYSYSVVTIDSSVTDFASFAKSKGITYKELKILNPWLRSTSLNNTSKKKYTIKILKRNSVIIMEPGDTTWLKTLPAKDFHGE